MSDLQHYIQTRQAHDAEFADGLETGYTNFKIGVLLRQAREADQLYRLSQITGRMILWPATCDVQIVSGL